jgi:hypothetical protein
MSTFFKKSKGFINIEVLVVFVVIIFVALAYHSVSEAIVDYKQTKVDLILAKNKIAAMQSAIDNEKASVAILRKELAIADVSLQELHTKRETNTKKLVKHNERTKVKEDEVITADLQLKSTGMLSEESLNKLSEIRSLALLDHYNNLFAVVNVDQPNS